MRSTRARPAQPSSEPLPRMAPDHRMQASAHFASHCAAFADELVVHVSHAADAIFPRGGDAVHVAQGPSAAEVLAPAAAELSEMRAPSQPQPVAESNEGGQARSPAQHELKRHRQ